MAERASERHCIQGRGSVEQHLLHATLHVTHTFQGVFHLPPQSRTHDKALNCILARHNRRNIDEWAQQPCLQAAAASGSSGLIQLSENAAVAAASCTDVAAGILRAGEFEGT